MYPPKLVPNLRALSLASQNVQSRVVAVEVGQAHYSLAAVTRPGLARRKRRLVRRSAREKILHETPELAVKLFFFILRLPVQVFLRACRKHFFSLRRRGEFVVVRLPMREEVVDEVSHSVQELDDTVVLIFEVVMFRQVRLPSTCRCTPQLATRTIIIICIHFNFVSSKLLLKAPTC